MNKTVLGAAVALALGLGGSARAAPLVLDLNGTSTPGGLISAVALDWAPTSFLAEGGNRAISAFGGSGCAGGACNFFVDTHARLTGYDAGTGAGFVGLPAGFAGEITMVARIQETVTSAPTPSLATFATTGVGYIEFYYSASPNANNLTGFGFNDGRLIGRISGIGASTGLFSIIDPTPIRLDNSGVDDYVNQQTATGIGTQATLSSSPTSTITLDPTFFLTTLAAFSINFQNISIGTPFGSVDPSDCFNTTANLSAIGSSQLSTCDNNHVNSGAGGLYSLQGGPGYTPNVGAVNGLGLGSPDFVAQTDFNSSVSGSLPEPGSLALVGVAFGALGFATLRARRK